MRFPLYFNYRASLNGISQRSFEKAHSDVTIHRPTRRVDAVLILEESLPPYAHFSWATYLPNSSIGNITSIASVAMLSFLGIAKFGHKYETHNEHHTTQPSA